MPHDTIDLAAAADAYSTQGSGSVTPEQIAPYTGILQHWTEPERAATPAQQAILRDYQRQWEQIDRQYHERRADLEQDYHRWRLDSYRAFQQAYAAAAPPPTPTPAPAPLSPDLTASTGDPAPPR